jgi:hypothetical protein
VLARRSATSLSLSGAYSLYSDPVHHLVFLNRHSEPILKAGILPSLIIL